ncbi:MAG: squalene/phytoene synthase family protein [candidate division Zixibacteria bacterium]|nr:squalene/phytoene synthase family protein [candidate division Zixibacteria bacterium]
MTAKKTTKLDFAPDIDFDEILTNPILDIAARFWENDRYEAFRICYRSMRVLDDLVDDQKIAGAKMSSQEQLSLAGIIDDWLVRLHRSAPANEFEKQLLTIIDKYKIPLWPWERLARAMEYDIYHDGFSSLIVFFRYCEGAAIAPASIFMHLCGVKIDKGNCTLPLYDIRNAARPLALFSYLVHIIRDFQKDQQDGLNYIADNMLKDEGISRVELVQIANGSRIDDRFRHLMARYHQIAEYYRRLARANLDKSLPFLTPRYQLSLEIIYGLYLQIYQRVKPDKGIFTSEELKPATTEIKSRLDEIISTFEPV